MKLEISAPSACYVFNVFAHDMKVTLVKLLSHMIFSFGKFIV